MVLEFGFVGRHHIEANANGSHHSESGCAAELETLPRERAANNTTTAPEWPQRLKRSRQASYGGASRVSPFLRELASPDTKCVECAPTCHGGKLPTRPSKRRQDPQDMPNHSYERKHLSRRGIDQDVALLGSLCAHQQERVDQDCAQCQPIVHFKCRLRVKG
jgi:hypothetical protein